jgi:hypothetical protein
VPAIVTDLSLLLGHIEYFGAPTTVTFALAQSGDIRPVHPIARPDTLDVPKRTCKAMASPLGQ